jgi:ribosomal subunit interface protein
MKTIIQVTRMENTEAIESYVKKKLAAVERLLDKNDTSAKAMVEVGLDTKHHKKGNVFFAEINLHTRQKNYRCVARAEDLYAAIDDVKDEISREVKSFREKTRDVAKRSARTAKRIIRKA